MVNQPFFNPHDGEMTFPEVIRTVVGEMKGHPKDRFEILIGTDSSATPKHLDLGFHSTAPGVEVLAEGLVLDLVPPDADAQS